MQIEVLGNVAARKGRPPKYDPKTHPERAEKFSLLGLTNLQMAEVFEITEETFYAWLRKHKAFSEAVTGGKVDADGRVARSMYEAACGYSHDAVHISVSAKGDVTEVPYTKHYPPDTKAAANWLANRQPKLWRPKPEAVEEKKAPGVMVVPMVDPKTWAEQAAKAQADLSKSRDDD